MERRELPVSRIMQTQFVSVRPTEGLDLAEQIMRIGHVRHLPVLDEGRLVGLLSQRDLLAASLTHVLPFEAADRRTFLHSIEVGEVMARDVRAATPDTSLAEAARSMIEEKIGCLPVIDEGRVMVGLVTETDLLRAAFLLPEAETARASAARCA